VGTSATTAKLTVDGGLGLAKGSQVFAGSDVITEFPKHDRPLTKYPEATSGTVVTNSTDTQPGTAFNLNYSDTGWHPTANYTSDTGVADGTTTTIDLNGIEYDGEWTQVLLPVAVKVKYLDVYYRYSDSRRQTRDGTVLGSNDGANWTHLQSWDDLSGTTSPSVIHHLQVNSTKYFKYIRYIVERVTSPDEPLPNIREIEIWGTEEGDESVDVVHRSIPNTPGQQQLAVYYEARDPNSYSFADSTKVYDLSGSGVTGTITGNNGFDAEYNAWVLDGSGDYVSGTLSGFTGPLTTLSVWVYVNSIDTSRTNTIASLGTPTDTNLIWLGINDSQQFYSGIHGDTGRDVYAGQAVINQWVHLLAVVTSNTLELYKNGTLLDSASYSSFTPGSSPVLYLGTRANTSGGPESTRYLDCSIANFRLYSKALNADQVRELYEYDAERFGHRQNLVALHKGNLGVGVPNPTSRFEVAGADGLQEFPPKAMTGFETYIEGHGVFRVSASSFLDASEISGWTQDFPTWYAFNKSNTQGWITDSSKYSNSDGIAGTSSDNRFGIRGEWLEIEMPSKIKLKHFTLSLASDGGDYSDAYNTSRFPQVFNLYKSNDGITWTPATEITTPTAPVLASYGSTQQYVIDENEYYNRYLIQVKQTFADGTYTGGQSTHTAIGEWRLFGTPAPSSLEDGHLTLGKALTLPRVSGHPARAETPRAESLVVHYDTTVDSVVSGDTVVDISGEGNNGTLGGDAAYSSTDRTFDFNGTGDISSTVSTFSGDQPHTMSVWVYISSALTTSDAYICVLAPSTGEILDQVSTIRFQNNGFNMQSFGNDVQMYDLDTQKDRWYHLIAVYDGGGVTTSSKRLYINGVQNLSISTDATSGNTINFTNTTLSLGSRVDGTGSHLKGSISNFKLWNVALTAEEVAMEYALGRTGKSLNLTDTALCLGGTVPRAQLDVRGSARFGTMNVDGNVGIGTVSPISRLDVSNLSNSKTTPTLTLNHSGVFDYASPSPSVWQSIDFTTQGLTRTRQCGINLLNYSSAGTGQNGIVDRLRTGLGFSVHNENGMVENALVINKDGNVGIGNMNPSYKLDVNGTVNTGALTATRATVPNDGDFVMGGKPLKPAVGLHWDRVNSRLEVNGLVGTSPTGGIIIPSGTTAQQPTGVMGMLRFNTTFGKLQVYDGNLWIDVGPNPTNAIGGTVTYTGGYTIHTFTSSDTFTVYTGGDVEYLVVAGGASGAVAHGTNGVGGGGAGGLLTGSTSVTAGTYTITIGSGGTGFSTTTPTSGNSGTDSSISGLGIIATGGGGGGGAGTGDGLDGGSGGGAATYSVTTGDTQARTGGSGVSGQGNDGRSTTGVEGDGGGGGGGAGATGGTIPSNGVGGAGGIGIQSSISGTATYYAGGGGATGWESSSGGSGGSGGGGAAGTKTTNATNATDGLGGGGGGAKSGKRSGDGGDGIVIIRYLT